MDIFQIDSEIRKLQNQRKGQAITVLFDVDKGYLTPDTKKSLQAIIDFMGTLPINNDIFLQEIETMLYRIKSRLPMETK